MKEKLSYWLTTYWAEFDHVYMKKKFVYDWPNVLIDQELFSSKIHVLSEELTEASRKHDKNIGDVHPVIKYEQSKNEISEKANEVLRTKLLTDHTKKYDF